MKLFPSGWTHPALRLDRNGSPQVHYRTCGEDVT